MGSAHVNLEGLEEGETKDVWIPLEKVTTGEVRLKIEKKKQEQDTEVSSFWFICNVIIKLCYIFSFVPLITLCILKAYHSSDLTCILPCFYFLSDYIESLKHNYHMFSHWVHYLICLFSCHLIYELPSKKYKILFSLFYMGLTRNHLHYIMGKNTNSTYPNGTSKFM